MQHFVEIPLRLLDIEGDGFHLMAEGSINGKPARFLIDTGASRSVFDAITITDFINAPKFEKKSGITAGVGNCELESSTFYIESLCIGNMEIHNYQGIALNLEAIHESYEKLNLPKAHGIIGGDLLNKHNAVINYRLKKMKLRL